MLILPARPDAPVACDFRGAPDTPDARLQAYADVFARSLRARERRPRAVVFTFHAGAREAVEALARLEAACCPFLGHRVEPSADAIVWTVDGGEGTDAILDALHALPDRAGDDFGAFRARLGADFRITLPA